jgi:hypothetical protein
MLSDGAIGQMMEKVYLSPQKERSKTVPEWATTGKPRYKGEKYYYFSRS